jgi:multiple antibiotic resistance protein
MGNLLNCTLYLIALINPVSKIFVLSVLEKNHSRGEIRSASLRSSVIAAVILFSFAVIGNIILKNIFHVEIYSFKIAAGVVLFVMGFRALFKGVFFETDSGANLSDISIVPLASPMIAGPATITAVISFSAEYGIYMASASMLMALSVNLLIMLSSSYISKFLQRYHLMEALIRITGLIVATIAVQMVLSGITSWIGTLR